MWLQSEITDEQKDELIQLARDKANSQNSYAPLQQQIDKAFTELSTQNNTIQQIQLEIQAIKKSLEDSGNPVEPVEPEPTPTDEYKPYVQPTGAHDAYQIDDKVLFNGKKYICIMNNCVWSPSDYPQGWQEVTE